MNEFEQNIFEHFAIVDILNRGFRKALTVSSTYCAKKITYYANYLK